MKKAEEEKEQSQQRTFNAFLRTQPYEIRPSGDWVSRGVEPPIDFVHEEKRIGVELTEWRGMERSQWVEERDRFRAELERAIEERRLANFAPGETGYTAEIQLRHGSPTRGSKPEIIEELLGFLDDFVRTKQARFSRHRIAYIRDDELPSMLQRVISRITLFEFPPGNIGIIVRAAQNVFDPAAPATASDVALRSFRQRLIDKAVKGADKYIREKELLQLDELWLVVHYSSPGVFPEPLSELGMDIGYGRHRRISQQAVAAKLKEVAEEIGGGPFERIYFLVDCQPEPFAELIWLKA
jgi:hypothetical protein